MGDKVTDAPEFGSVASYAQILRRAAKRNPELIDTVAFALVQVIAGDEFIGDGRKLDLIKNLAAAVQLIDAEPAPIVAGAPAVGAKAGSFDLATAAVDEPQCTPECDALYTNITKRGRERGFHHDECPWAQILAEGSKWTCHGCGVPLAADPVVTPCERCKDGAHR